MKADLLGLPVRTSGLPGGRLTGRGHAGCHRQSPFCRFTTLEESADAWYRREREFTPDAHRYHDYQVSMRATANLVKRYIRLFSNEIQRHGDTEKQK